MDPEEYDVDESNRAGQDDHEQLKVAIKAYVWAEIKRLSQKYGV